MQNNTSSNIKTVTILAVPVILENLMQTGMGTVDLFFAGQLEDLAIAAVGVTSLVMNLFLAFFTAIGIGTVAMIARKVGANDRQSASKTAQQAIILAGIVGLLLGFLGSVLYVPILTLCGVDSDVLEYAAPYYFVVASPCVFLALTLTLSSCLRATGNTRAPMIVTAFSVLINIVLDYAFIKAGLGIFGLGFATSISRVFSSSILLMLLFKGTTWISLKGLSWIPARGILGALTCIGLPAAFERLIMRVGQLVYNSMILSLGTSVYVAHTVAGNVEAYSYIFAMGFSTATATLVGLSLGEKNSVKARGLVKLTSCISIFSLIPITFVFIFFSEQITGLFTDSPDVIKATMSVLFVIALVQPAVALSQTLTGALQGAGDTRFPLYTTFLGTWVIRIGVGWLLAFPCSLGLLGVWSAYALDLIVRTALLGFRFKRGQWEKIEIREGKSDGRSTSKAHAR